MNRKLGFFVCLIGLFVVSLFVGGETKSVDVEKDSSVFVSDNSLDVYYFYGQGCSHCANVEPFLAEMEQKYPLQLHRYDIYTNRGYISILDEYSRNYGLTRGQRGIPAIFVSDACFVGDKFILDAFEETLRKALEKSSSTDQVLEVVGSESSDRGVAHTLNNLSIFTVTMAALVDAVSPCSIAVLVFLIGARLLVVNRKKRALKIGLTFCLSVFIAYFLFGLGVLKIVQASGFSSGFSLLVGLIAVLAGVFYLRDVFWYGRGGFVMEVPRSLKPLLMKMLKGVTSPFGAFAMGFVVSCFELPCTGGPYLFILGQLANSATFLQAIPFQLVYNFIFVTPLIALTLAIYFGSVHLEKARKWTGRNKRSLNLARAFAMITVGLLTIPLSQVVQVTVMALSIYKSMFMPFMILPILYVAYKTISHFPERREMFCSALLITCISLNISFVPLKPVFNDGSTFPGFVAGSFPGASSASVSYVTLVVDGKGEGGYTSLAEALENVINPSESVRWRIIIRSNDIPYVEDWSLLYDASKPYVEILGEDREAVVIKHSGSTSLYDREGLRLLPGMIVSNLTIDCDYVRDSAALIMGRWNSDPADWPINGNYTVSNVNMYNCPYGGSTVVTYRGRDQNYLTPGEHHYYVEDVYYKYDETLLGYEEQREKEMFKAWGHSWKVQHDPGYSPSIFLQYKNIRNEIVELRHEAGNHGEQTCIALIVHCSECSYEETSNYMKVNQFISLDNFNCSYYAPDYQYYIFNPWEVRNDFGNFDPPLAYDTINLTDSFWEIVINVDFNIYPGTVTVEDLSQDVYADDNLNFIDEGIQPGNRFIIEGGSGYYRCEYIIWQVHETTLTLNKPFGEGNSCRDDLGTGTHAKYRIGKSHSTNMGMTPSPDPARPEIPACYVRDFQFLVYDPDEGLNPIPERRDGLGGYPRGLTSHWIPPKCDSQNVYSNIWSFGDPPSTPPGPAINIVSPENKTYATDSVNLTFIADEPSYWKGYILDNNPVTTIGGNATLTHLPSGSHCLTLFARRYEYPYSTSMGSSSVCFSTQMQLIGDLNGDGIVDIYDVVTVSLAFGSELGDENWDAVADTNQDGTVDIYDVVTVTTNFGKTSSNETPVLSNGYVTPSEGETTTLFDYYVNYYDPDGDVPTQRDVCVDGAFHQMTLVNGTASYGVYKYQSTLFEGSHNYYFEFSDGVNPPVRLPSSGYYDGPIVNLPSGQVELYYDDGIAEEGYGPTVGLYTYAVHFQTPTATSYKLSKVKYYIYSSPASFYVDIRDASLQQLHYGLTSPSETGWFIVDLSSEDIFVQGDFYVGMKYSQLYEPEIGADNTNPDGESGEGLHGFPTPNISSLDWMIRVVIEEI